MEAAGGMTDEVEHRIVWASRTFESLCNAVFMGHDLNLKTKRLLWHWMCCDMVHKLGPHLGSSLKFGVVSLLLYNYVALGMLGGLYSRQSISLLPS